MIYLIGGAPRVGKTTLCQKFAAELQAGWVTTDLLADLLRVDTLETGLNELAADPEAISARAEWFYPYLERLIWGIRSLASHYIIEGIEILPAQVVQLAARHPVKAVFVGCTRMTLEQFDRIAGSEARLPEERRRQMAAEIALWSEFIRQEAQRFGYPYIDLSDDFSAGLEKAALALKTVSGDSEANSQE